jgi:multidrug efflux pump subunit AcrA (membrane-fusion protein)
MRWPVRRTPAFWLAIGVPALAVLGVGGYAMVRPAASTVQEATVAVQRGTVGVTLSAAGTVQPQQTRGLSFSTAGVVTELDVKPGDTVSAGQVLARIDGTAVLDEVNTAQANVNSASDALARAQQAATATATAAACGGQAAPAALVEPTTSESPSASPSAPASGRPSATATSHPTGQPTGQPSRQPTTARTCGTGGGGTNGGAGRGAGGDSLLSAQQQLTNAQLALQLAQDKLAGTAITAPVAGRVLSVAAAAGAQESPGGSGFIVLGGVDENDVRAQFSEADVGQLAVGQSATITLPNRPGATLNGKVSQIDPAGVISGRLVRYGVVIAFDQAPDDVLLGESANVSVVTRSVNDVLYLPSAAVNGVVNGTGTVIVHANGHDSTRTVQVGLRGDQFTEIRSGLGEGDQVVLAARR